MKRLIISDFSKTLTAPEGKSSWSLFALSGVLPQEYVDERNRLFEEYHPYEIVGNNEMVSEWFAKHLDLLERFQAQERIPDVLEHASRNGFIAPRGGLAAFADWIKSQETTEFQIVSSGITELIREFMKPYGLTMAYPQSWHGRGLQANDIAKAEGGRSVQIPKDKLFSGPPENEDMEIVILGDSPEDFSVSRGTFGISNRLRGFSFSDTAPQWVVALGRGASLESVIRAIEGV